MSKLKLIANLLNSLRAAPEIAIELESGQGLGRRLGSLLLLMTISSALYGAVLGAWTGGRLIAFAAIKLPLVLLLTTALTAPLNWAVAAALGLRAGFLQALVLTAMVLALAGVVLASLLPAVALFTLSAAPPGLAARATHNVLYLLHTAIVGGAGLIGLEALGRLLARLLGDESRARRIRLAWIATFAFVGGEVAWALRPFVGSIYLPTVFLRADALDGNVWEFVITDIVPFLLGKTG